MSLMSFRGLSLYMYKYFTYTYSYSHGWWLWSFWLTLTVVCAGESPLPSFLCGQWPILDSHKKTVLKCSRCFVRVRYFLYCSLLSELCIWPFGVLLRKHLANGVQYLLRNTSCSFKRLMFLTESLSPPPPRTVVATLPLLWSSVAFVWVRVISYWAVHICRFLRFIQIQIYGATQFPLWITQVLACFFLFSASSLVFVCVLWVVNILRCFRMTR